MVDFVGWDMPIHYDVIEEPQGAEESCWYIRRLHMGEIFLTGKEAGGSFFSA